LIYRLLGCSGAIGLQLAEKIISIKGDKSVVAALHRTPLPSYLESRVICEFGFNIQSDETIRALLTKYKDTIEGIWNLAAPLSVDTAKDPDKAHDITVGGMSRLLSAMKDILNVEQCRVFFSDSIGSFGSSSPRLGSSAKWLIENPNQDPGSDYGKQKRECRDLLSLYRNENNFDCRFAIIPGVLHNQSSWGGGTTE
jgi:nucleoside-diphosphate-sugar epimerase